MKNTKQYIISDSFSIKETLKQMDIALANTLFIIKNGILTGSVSSGDIRRALLKEINLTDPVSTIMNASPVYVNEVFEWDIVKQLFIDKKISAIPILNHSRQLIEVILRKDIFEEKDDIHPQINLPVVIMAGGLGSRLDPLTRVIPKALIPIDDKPIIEIIMDEFHKYGMKDFTISLHHKSKMIKAYFQEHESNYHISFIKELTPLGTAGGLKSLQNKIKTPFFVSNCDILVKTDYSDIAASHEKGHYSLTMIASMQHHIIPYGICKLNKNGSLKNIDEKPEYDFLVNTGMYVLNPEVLEYIPENKMFHMTDLIDTLKQNGHNIGVYPVSEKSWIDIGQWEKYRESIHQMNSLLKDPV